MEIRQENLRIKGLSDEANAFVYKNVEEVTRTNNLLDADDLEKIAQLIGQAETIMTISRGVNAGVCDDLTHRLQTVGKNTISRYYDNMVMYAERLTTKDLVIVISSKGDEKLIVSAVKKAQKKGAKAIILTCEYQSALAQLADYALLAYRTKLEKEELGGDAESTIPMELLSRVMVDMYVIFKEKGTIRG
jgi:DNA-binding MurR/RpiR family transcriptional regulator